MWPLGFILGADYSPLRLELQHPETNWRDMFEDLLALECGKKMISAVSRQKEAATSYRLLNESVHEDINQVNLTLQRNQDFNVLLHKLRDISIRTKDAAILSKIDEEALPFQKEVSERAIADGKNLIASLTGLQNKPASSYKTRLPWIVSLISSGAMLGWDSVVYDVRTSPAHYAFVQASWEPRNIVSGLPCFL